MSTSLNGTGVTFNNGVAQNSAFNWNMSQVNVTVANGGVYTLPARCIGVFVWCGMYGGANNGSINRVIVRDASNNVLNTIQVNRMSGGDGGSGMWDGAGSFIPVPSNATNIVMSTSGSSSNQYIVQVVVTR